MSIEKMQGIEHEKLKKCKLDFEKKIKTESAYLYVLNEKLITCSPVSGQEIEKRSNIFIKEQELKYY